MCHVPKRFTLPVRRLSWRLISGLSGALRQVGDAAASVLGGRGVRMDEDGQGPFEAAVQAAAGSGNDTDA